VTLLVNWFSAKDGKLQSSESVESVGVGTFVHPLLSPLSKVVADDAPHLSATTNTAL
jgi:hypothetical protein